MSMLTWHQKAARLAAQKPYLSWSQVCAELGRRPRKQAVPARPALVRLPYADS